MEIIERITETLEKTDKKATDLCDRLGIRTCLPGKLAIATRQQNTSSRLQTSWACQFITY